MKSVGIVCEYNPLHNGHLYHLTETKKRFPNHTVILVLSGNFTQRGELSLINKWDKTKLSLLYGVDLVVELPYPFATQSADIFARGAMEILNSLKVDVLVFGSESNDVTTLKKLADIQLYNPAYEKLINQYMKEGMTYASALSKGLEVLTGHSVKTPNDILGLSYIRELKKLNSSIEVVSIVRTNDYHNPNFSGEISSATSIRKALQEDRDVSSYIPSEVGSYLMEPIYIDQFFPFLKLKLISEQSFLHLYQDVDEKIKARIQKYILESDSLEELLQKIKTKNVTYHKLKRMMLHILCGFTKEDAKKYAHISYIRVLGFSQLGKLFLKEQSKERIIPILSKFEKVINLELKMTVLYSTLFPKEKQEFMIKQEYQQIPIQQNIQQ